MTFLAIFMFINLLFAVFLMLSGDHWPKCIIVSGEHFDVSEGTSFSDAFALSWTTFTTVVSNSWDLLL